MHIFAFKKSNLDKEIDAVIDQMSGMSSDDDRYSVMADNLERLYKSKAREVPRRVSPDAIANIAATLGSIVLIMTFEKTQIMTTKALNFVPKLKS